MPLARSYITTRGFRGNSKTQIVPSALVKQTFTAPATAVGNGFSVAHAGQAVAGTVNMTLGGSLGVGGVGVADVARNAVIVVTHGSAVIAMNGIITGFDIFGQPATEAWSVTAGGTTKTFTGKKAFKRITSITETIVADASTNTIIAGTGVVLGLDKLNAVDSAVKEVSNGAVVATGALLTGVPGSATSDPRGTYAPASAPNGVQSYVLWYISDVPENDLARV